MPATIKCHPDRSVKRCFSSSLTQFWLSCLITPRRVAAQGEGAVYNIKVLFDVLIKLFLFPTKHHTFSVKRLQKNDARGIDCSFLCLFLLLEHYTRCRSPETWRERKSNNSITQLINEENNDEPWKKKRTKWKRPSYCVYSFSLKSFQPTGTRPVKT